MESSKSNDVEKFASAAPGVGDQGMSAGAAMAFMIAGAVSSNPAMAAVWSLVRVQVFAACPGIGVLGAILSGKLIVVDPRNAGLAHRADSFLQVRPGTDGALALGLCRIMISNGWYDADFLRSWTNAPALVREDTGRLLRAADIHKDGDGIVAWSDADSQPVVLTPGSSGEDLALTGKFVVATTHGSVVCRPVFQLWFELCENYHPAKVEHITGVPAEDQECAARLIWHNRPVGYMAWSGLEQQSNATQIARAIGLLYAMTGSYDAPGGNVEFPTVPQAELLDNELLSKNQRSKTLGLKERPLGVARFDHVCSADIYRGILEHDPYAVRGLVSFGSNLMLAHADGATAAKALQALDFHLHVDLFMNPSAEYADIVLPTTSPFEAEGLKVGFETSAEACSLVQLRQQLVPPRGEARPDIAIIFDLACRLGLGEYFWNGDVDTACKTLLEPSGVTLEALRAAPEGLRMPLETRYRKYAEMKDGVPRGFNTPSRRVEFFSETLLDSGYAPLPDYEEPLVSPRSDPELACLYPLVLTWTKEAHYCESQHRGLPSLRRRAPDPQIDLHPQAAAERGIEVGDWVRIETPNGAARARARFDDMLLPDVVCGQHGWWQACVEVGAPGYPALGDDTANFNLLIGHKAVDPVSGSVPMRAYVCEVRKIVGAVPNAY